MSKEVDNQKKQLIIEVIGLIDYDNLNCADALDVLEAVKNHYYIMIMQNTNQMFGITNNYISKN